MEEDFFEHCEEDFKVLVFWVMMELGFKLYDSVYIIWNIRKRIIN